MSASAAAAAGKDRQQDDLAARRTIMANPIRAGDSIADINHDARFDAER
jgi:hypothetical protein